MQSSKHSLSCGEPAFTTGQNYTAKSVLKSPVGLPVIANNVVALTDRFQNSLKTIQMLYDCDMSEIGVLARFEV